MSLRIDNSTSVLWSEVRIELLSHSSVYVYVIDKPLYCPAERYGISISSVRLSTTDGEMVAGWRGLVFTNIDGK